MNPWGLNDLDHKGNGMINRSYGGKRRKEKKLKLEWEVPSVLENKAKGNEKWVKSCFQ